MKNNKLLSIGMAAALAAGLLAGCGQAGTTETAATAAPAAQTESGAQLASLTEASAVTVSDPVAAEVDTDGATAISLSGTGATVDGSGASAENGVVTITDGGTYVLSGTLTEGRVIVDARGEDVTLVLNGVSITCSYGSPLYIYKASSAVIELAEGSENILTDGTSYTFADSYSSAEDEEPNACLYSKADLVIQGGGSLTVNANYNNGITSKDTLAIIGATITVNAANNGITGKDSGSISGATITVSCGGDAIRSTNDTDGTLGWVYLQNSDLTLIAGEDGVQAETVLTIDGGSYTVTTGGGSGKKVSGDTSAKGLKAGTELNLLGGTFVLDCSDDAIHSDGNVTITDGDYTISTGDDGIHADVTVRIDGGSFNVTAAEGIEGTYIQINGGTIYIEASDDGINAARKSNAYTPTVEINGGEITIVMGAGDTDGIDSNGNIVVNGGTIDVTGNSTFDYDGTATYNGGTIIVNGQQVDSIPNQMMGGFGGGMGGWGGQMGGMGGNMGGGRGGRGGF